MRAAVVYESWYGNTRQVAETIARELRRDGEVDVLSVDEPPPPLDELDLLVVGAPTHIHGLSSASSRKSAIEHGHDPGPPGIGVRGWLKLLPEVEGRRAAAFDTRLDKPVVLVGSAARGIARRLRRHGFELIVAPESFFVLDAEGPLEDGDLDRARKWARELAAATKTVPAQVA
jgi:flavodoxin